MVEILGVVKLSVPVPPARTVPPVAAAYQSIVSPVPTVAVRLTVPGPHLAKGPVPATGAVGAALTVAVMGVLVVETQDPAVLLDSA